jgi:CRISPR-associated exonuclease Cas4
MTRGRSSNDEGKTMYTEDDFIQLSALQHYVFCPRQCALIHVEDVWNENVYTVRGGILHEKVDADTYETRGTLKTVRGLRIHSFRYGLAGRCDVVEFRVSQGGSATPEVMPVEFKSGQPKHDISDEVQLCAQALCLEEMLNTQVKRGAFFYGRIRRRVQVELGDELRKQTEEIIAAVHDMISHKLVPQAKYMEKCRSCSLLDTCQPKAMNTRKLHNYLEALYQP